MLVARCSVFAILCLLFVVGRRSLFVVRGSLFAACCSICVDRCVLLVGCCLSVVDRCFVMFGCLLLVCFIVS